jgi:cobalamin-independent methionine synthase catalytic subunit
MSPFGMIGRAPGAMGQLPLPRRPGPLVTWPGASRPGTGSALGYDGMTTNLDFLRADHVGGLPRPAWLRDRQDRFQRGEIGAAELKEDHRTAVAALVRRQQDVGLGVLTDGEVARSNFQESFGGAVTGYDALPYEYPRIVPEQVALCPRSGFGASNSGEDVVWRKLALIREVADETWR